MQNTECVENDVSLVDTEFFGYMVLHIDNKHGRIQSWTGIIDHSNYHSRTKNLTIAETLQDYSNERHIVVRKSAKSGHNSIVCKVLLPVVFYSSWAPSLREFQVNRSLCCDQRSWSLASKATLQWSITSIFSTSTTILKLPRDLSQGTFMA